MENKDNLSDFECNVVVGARWADFSISETTNLLLFFAHFYGLGRILKIEWQFSGWKHLVTQKTLITTKMQGLTKTRSAPCSAYMA